MARLIDADALLEELSKGTIITDDLYGMGIMAGNDHAMNKIKNAPTIEAEPVRHGRWIWADDGYLRCSECMQKAPAVPQYQDEPITIATAYCPNCGAKMDGEQE